MKKEIKLSALRREKGRSGGIRRAGFIPAVLYGSGSENISLKLKKVELEKVFSQAGESTLVDLKIEQSAPVKVLIHEVQRDPVKGNIIHLDFYKVDMKEKLTTSIPLNFIGEARAVRELGGIFIKNFDDLEIECLPSDLVSQIDVDLSFFENLNQPLKAGDIKLPAGLALITSPEEIVANVIEQREEVEEVSAPAAVPAEDEGKKEEGEKKEGEAKESKKE